MAERRQPCVRAFAHNGLGDSESRLREDGGCPELVHGALDRARGVHHRDALLLQGVQRVHPEDDLLEGARGDDPRQHGVAGAEVRLAGGKRRGRATETRHQHLVGEDASLVAPRGERAAELVGVPALPRGEDRDAHGG